MGYIYRLFLAICSSIFVISACGIEPTKGSDAATEASFAAKEQVEEAEETEASDLSEPKTTTPEVKANEKSEPTEKHSDSNSSDKSKAPDSSEAVADDTPASDADELASLEETAVDTLISTTDLDVQNYSYLLMHEEDYVEIEVRQLLDDAQAHAPLQGIYRYYPMTQEVFIRDYLTGEYLLYEDYQAMQSDS